MDAITEIRNLPAATDLERLENFTKEGKFMQAWEIAGKFAPLSQWAPGEPMRLAALLASNLGADRLASILHRRNWRANRENDRYFMRMQYWRLGEGRWLEAKRDVENRLARGVDDPVSRADMKLFLAWIYASWLDFEMAYPLVGEAIDLNGESAWTHVSHAAVLVCADRREEALEAVNVATSLREFYRPAVLRKYELLIELGRPDEAHDYLRDRAVNSEQADFHVRLNGWYSERDECAKALVCLDEYERLSPLLEKKTREWLAGRRANLYLQMGEIALFHEQASRTKEKSYYRKVSKNLLATEGQPLAKKRLDVKFIKQHRMTCAPATLASIAAYWGWDEDHLAIADAICYDGTPWHKERIWASGKGFIVREFKVTPEVARELIDRGIPFTLTTSWATGAHLQACIGYDEFQKCCVIRDPTHAHFSETLWKNLAEEHPEQGPRGMVFLPAERIELLDGVTLPDEAMYDAFHDYSLAADRHDRKAMEEAHARMIGAGGEEHPMVWWVNRILAEYDGSHEEEMYWEEKLVERFPKVEKFQYWRVRTLGKLGRRVKKEEVLQEITGRKKCAPVFYSELGELYSADARRYVLADHYLRKAVRYTPTEGRNYSSLGHARSEARLRDEALVLHRAASTLEGKFEPYARTYFDACVAMGRREEGLAYLAKRVEAARNKSSEPWQSLIWAYEKLGRTIDAKTSLREACAAWPDDGELLVQAADWFSGWGEADEAWRLLDQARGVVAASLWHETAGRMANFLGDRVRALDEFREAARLSPGKVEYHRWIARLEEEAGEGGALRYLRGLVAENSATPRILGLFAEWCGAGKEENEEAIAALRTCVEIHPHWPWAWRELALDVELTGDVDEALALVRHSIDLAPNDAFGHGILGGMLERQERWPEAAASLQRAVELDIDYGWAIARFMSVSRRQGKAAEALEVIRNQIEEQVSDGEAVFAYREQAFSSREPADLLADLREFCDRRPDLWQVWSARKDQALAMDLADDADSAVAAMVERFPLTPRTYLDRASVHHHAGRYEEEINDLLRARELSPAWAVVGRRLSEAYERLGRIDEALSVLLELTVTAPLEAGNHGMAARLLHKKGEVEEAFDRMKKGVVVSPSYEWGWTQLARWGKEQERVAEVRELLESLHPSQAHAPRWWETRQEVIATLEDPAAGLVELEHGLEKFPRNETLLDLHVCALVNLGRFDEALQACEFPMFGEEVPLRLRGRKGWVLLQTGHAGEAIRLTDQLVEESPDYTWAWYNLMVWNAERGKWKRSLAAAKQLNRLTPDDAVAWGYRAQAARNLNLNDEARECFEKAWLLDPEYSYAGRELIELLSKEGKHEEARQRWREVMYYTPGPYVLVDGIAMELAAGDLPAATALAERLMDENLDTDDGPLFYAADVFKEHDKGHLLGNIVSERVENDPPKPIVAAWAREMIRRQRLDAGIRKLESLDVPAERKAAAWIHFLEALDEEDGKKGRRQLMELVRKHGQEFRSDQQLFLTVLNLLTKGADPQPAREWFDNAPDFGEVRTGESFLREAYIRIRSEGLASAIPALCEGLRRFPARGESEFLRGLLVLAQEYAGERESSRMNRSLLEEDPQQFPKAMRNFSDALVECETGERLTIEAKFAAGCRALGNWEANENFKTIINEVAAEIQRRAPKLKASRLVKSNRPEDSERRGGLSGWQWFWIIFLILQLFRLVARFFLEP